MKHVPLFLAAAYVFFRSAASAYAQPDAANVLEVPLEELLNVKISAAAKYEQTIAEAPASVTIITSEEIERYGYRTLEEVLVSVRGFYASNDRNYSYLGVRGFSRPTDYNNRVLLLINGHSTNENVYGSTFIETALGLHLDMIERIEIVRGPGSALYGTNAMFAVINIITKQGNAIDGVKVLAEAGSYGKRQGAVEIGREFDNGFQASASVLWGDIRGEDLYFAEYDDPSTNNGVAEELDWDRYFGVLARVSYGELELQGMWTRRRKGIPTGAFGIAFNDDAAQTMDARSFIEIKYDHPLAANKNVTIRGYFDHYTYEGTYPYDDEEYAADFLEASEGHWFGGEFQFRWDVRWDNRLIFGAENRSNVRADYRSWDADEVYFDDNFPFNIFSLYLQDEYQLREDLTLTLGIRRDQYSTVGSSTTPRGALIYYAGQSTTLKLLYGEAFRAPNVFEVYYEAPNEAKGNPNLKPEKIRTAEIVWEQRLSDELFGMISLYNHDVKDLIDQDIDPADELLQFQNVSRIVARGVELELNARLKNGLHGYASYIFQRAKDAESSQRLTNSPAHMLKLGVSYPVLKHFYAGTEWRYESDRRTVYGDKTGSYLLTNLHLSTATHRHGGTFLGQLLDHARLSFLVRNLFDVTYRTPGGFEHLQHGIIQNGRNFAVELQYKF